MLNDKTVKSFSNLVRGLDNHLQSNPQSSLAKIITPEWIIKDLLPKGKVTALFGENVKEKLLLLHQLATSSSTGLEFLSSKMTPLTILYVTSSDQSNEIYRRQLDINSHYGLKMSNISKLKFTFYEKGKDACMVFDQYDTGHRTEYFYEIKYTASYYKADLVIVDNFRDLFSGQLYNNLQIEFFIENTFKHLAKETGAAVLISNTAVNKENYDWFSFSKLNNMVNLCWHLVQSDSGNIKKNQRLLARSKLNDGLSYWGDIILQLDNGFFTQGSSLVATKNSSK
ncbi:MAG: AAA family ATPase [Rickettsiaceae bacterium]|nr:AAA family ATPase [Rickettsiaceae bacterium]